MEQRSKEWFSARKGKLTGSNIGAALGVNPWKTPEDLIRQMVREHHGAESEFSGNIATQWGQTHEPMAILDYEMSAGLEIREVGFVTHPEYEWLGASPDGLIGADAVAEIKCPFGQRKKAVPEFKSALDQPHYYAQMQVEMACTGRSVCHFYQWSPNGDKIEIVPADADWWNKNFPILEAFYERFLSETYNLDHMEPLLKEINTQKSKALIDEYADLTDAIDQATERKRDLLQELTVLAKNRNALVHGCKLTKVERKGSVDYKSVPELKGVDLEKYRKKSSSHWRLSL